MTNDTCAEPGCTTELAPRVGGELHFLHCDQHRTAHQPIPADHPEPPKRYSRVRCTCCGAVFEKYTSALRGTTGRYFCSAECRNDAGPRVSRAPKLTCENCQGTYQVRPAKSATSRFCSQDCAQTWRAAQPRTRKRPTTVTDTEVRICPQPGCTNELAPRDPTNGYRRKWCDEHSNRSRGTGTRPTSSKTVTLTCSREGCVNQFERLAANIRQNAATRHFCTAECRKADGWRRVPEDRKTQCEMCPREFKKRPDGTNRFCSTECANVWRRRHKDVRRCEREGCDTTFEVAKSEPDRFCSKACFEASRATPIGARKLTSDGYVTIYAPDHPMAQPSTGWAMEHRVVISDILGRPLLPTEEVHHRSGVRTENRPDQLVLMSKSHPAGAGLRDTLDWCRRFIVENEAVAEKLEAAGVHTSLDGDDAVVPLLGSEA